MAEEIGGLNEFSSFRPAPASYSQPIIPTNLIKSSSSPTSLIKPTPEEEQIYSLLFPKKLTDEQQYQGNRNFFVYILLSAFLILFTWMISNIFIKFKINKCRTEKLNEMKIPHRTIMLKEKIFQFLNK